MGQHLFNKLYVVLHKTIKNWENMAMVKHLPYSRARLVRMLWGIPPRQVGANTHTTVHVSTVGL